MTKAPSRWLGALLQLVEKASQSFAAMRRNKVQAIFSGGVYVGKNSSRPANVRAVRRRRAASAMQSGRNFN
jgi:hypothetical protein